MVTDKESKKVYPSILELIPWVVLCISAISTISIRLFASESILHSKASLAILNTATAINLGSTPIRELFFEPISVLIKALLQVAPELLLAIVPFILLIGSLVIARSLREQYNINALRYSLFVCLFLVTPLTYSLLSTLNPWPFVLFAFLLAMHFLEQKKSITTFMAGVLLILFAAEGIAASVLAILMVAGRYFLKRDNQKTNRQKESLTSTAKSELDSLKQGDTVSRVLLSILFLILIVQSIVAVYLPTLRDSIIMSLTSGSSYFSLLTGLDIFGISIFIVILAIAGASRNWKRRLDFPLYSIVIVAALLAAFSIDSRMLLSIGIIYFASSFLKFLLERKWSDETIKTFTLVLIVCGLLFSQITYFDQVKELEPQQELIAALEWLETDSLDRFDARITELGILGIEQQQETIKRYSSHPAHSTKEFREDPFTINYLPELAPMLEEQQIHFIIISNSTRKRYYAEQGLIFLLRNERFKMRYAQNGVEIWEFLPETVVR